MDSNKSSADPNSLPLFSGEEPTYSQLPGVIAGWDRERKQYPWELSSEPKPWSDNTSNSQISEETSSFQLFSGEEPTYSQLPGVIAGWDRDRTQYSCESEIQPNDDIPVPLMEQAEHTDPAIDFNWSYQGGVENFDEQFAQPLEDPLDMEQILEIERSFGFVEHESLKGGIHDMDDQFAQLPEDPLLDNDQILEIERQFGFVSGESSNDQNNQHDYSTYKCLGYPKGCRLYHCSVCFPNLN